MRGTIPMALPSRIQQRHLTYDEFLKLPFPDLTIQLSALWDDL
jgi:hypothetical protein